MLGLRALALVVAATMGPPSSPGFSEILPPGNNGNVTPAAFAQNQLTGNCADFGPHYCDQLSPYLNWQWSPDGFRSRNQVNPGDTVEELRGGTVRIVRDAPTGDPHVWGSPDAGTSGANADSTSLVNMAFGIGVAEAEDRLFQLEVFRRAAEGTLSELLGPSMLQYDEQYRRDTETAAERDADIAQHLDPVSRAALDAYTAGINTVIARDTLDPIRLPTEFSLLVDLPIRPWTDADSLAIGTLEIKAEAEAGGQELVVAADLQKIASATGGQAGLQRAAALLDDWYFREDPSTPTSIEDAPGPAPDVYPFTPADTLARLKALPANLASWPPAGVNLSGSVSASPSAASTLNTVARTIFSLGLPHFGSNAVAVGPGHTTTGGALLYGGPQAGYDTPPVFERIEAHANHVDIAGVAVPGAGPVLVIGHTATFAWSITTGQDDQVDSYLERIRRGPGSSLQVWYQGGWRPVAARTETFRYRALNSPLPAVTSATPPVYKTATTTVYSTTHAGVPSPIIAMQWDPGGQTGWAMSKTRAFWNTAAQTGIVFKNIVYATSAAQFGAAVLNTPPAFNFVYADAAGHIGYWHTGLVPLRAPGHDPRLPANGDGSMDWRGYLPIQQEPHVIDPPQGWIASWNNRAAADFPDSGDGTVWGTDQRVLSIQRDLATRLARGPIDAGALSAVMENVGSHDLPAQLYFRDLLLRLRSSTTLSAAARSALTRISAWNGDVYYPYGADAATVLDPAATIFDQWFHDLEDTILRPVFQPAGPTPWTVNSFDDATTGPADGGRNEFNDNLEPVVLHAIQDVPAIPLHIDWLPAWATGPTRAARVDSLSAAVLERAVTELTTAFKTPDQTRWLEPTLKTTYMSLGAGSVPNEPFENRGVYGLLAAFPAPVALPSPTGAVRRGGGVLPATGGGNASGALGALALAGALFLRRRRRLQSRARATIAADPSAASKARIIASWWNDASKLPARSQIWPRT